MNIDEEIENLIMKLGQNYKTLQYVYNNTEKFIPGKSTVLYSGPYWDNREVVAAIRTLLVGKWISSGEEVRKFEKEFSKKVNQNYAVMVNSGSSANLVMIGALKRVLGWQDGDEIIVSVVGFPTTVAPIIQNNLKPSFVDIEMKTLNFDLDKIESKITDKTKAIFLSPVLGNPPDMDRLLQICEDNKLYLILDNCDSLGSCWRNRLLNEYSVASSYSFYPAHHITTGEGGMVTSNNPEIIRVSRSMAWWGRDCYCVGAENLLPNGMCKRRFDNWLDDSDLIVDHKYFFSEVGMNLKPLDCQGAIGQVQLQKLDEIHEKRKNNKKIISNLFLKYIPNIKIPEVYPEADVSWFGTPFIMDCKESKNKLVKHLENSKVQTRNYFAGNIIAHPAYKNLGNYKDYPNANRVLEEVFFIGCFPGYTKEVFDYIESVLKSYEQ